MLREGRRKRGSCAVFGWFGGLKLGKKKNGHAKTKEGSRSEITLPVVPLQVGFRSNTGGGGGSVGMYGEA